MEARQQPPLNETQRLLPRPHLPMERRHFLKAGAFLASLGPDASAGTKSRRGNLKAFKLSTLQSLTADRPKVLETFAMIRAAGFHGVEVRSAFEVP